MFDNLNNEYWTREVAIAHETIRKEHLHPKAVIMACVAAAAATGQSRENIVAELVRITDACLSGQLFSVEARNTFKERE